MFKAYPFVPDRIVEAGPGEHEMDVEVIREVAALFAAENERRNGKLFDGLLFSVERLDEEQIVGRFVRYSLFIAQLARPDLFDALRIQPLGVSGLLTCADGIVFGRRDSSVTQDAGLWELVPAGGIDPSSRDGTGGIDAVRQVIGEMYEEVGVGVEQVGSTAPFAVVEDLDRHVIEVAVAIETPLNSRAIRRLFRQGASGEYAELTIVPLVGIREFVGRCGDDLAAISPILLRKRGLL